MSGYRRWKVHGGSFFFTLVVNERRHILTTDVGRQCLRTAIEEVRNRHPFEIVAIVLLPDHLHTVWQLPVGDNNYSLRWRQIKTRFTQEFLAAGGREGFISPSKILKQERGIWQRRFYEHTCRDEDDLKRCVDYVHVNPLKHRLVSRVSDWRWSTFHEFVKQGEYELGWGSGEWFGDEFTKWEYGGCLHPRCLDGKVFD